MAEYIGLIIEGLIFMLALLGAVGSVWTKLTHQINEKDRRLVKVETELQALQERDRRDSERWETAFERFKTIEAEMGSIDKKVGIIAARLGGPFPDENGQRR